MIPEWFKNLGGFRIFGLKSDGITPKEVTNTASDGDPAVSMLVEGFSKGVNRKSTFIGNIFNTTTGLLEPKPLIDFDAGLGERIFGLRCIINPVNEDEAASVLSLSSEGALPLLTNNEEHELKEDNITSAYIVAIGSVNNTPSGVIASSIPSTLADKTTAFNNAKLAMTKIEFLSSDNVGRLWLTVFDKYNSNRDLGLSVGGSL